MGKRETFWLWNTLNVKFCPRTSWKNTMAIGIKNSHFQVWVKLEKKSRDNNVYDYDNLMRKTKTFLGKHKGKWIRKQTHSRFSHDGKHIKTKQGIRLWQPNEKIKKLVRKKKCLNGTQIMETSILAQKKQLEEKKKKNHAEFFFEPWLKLPLILSRLMGWYTNWYRLEW